MASLCKFLQGPDRLHPVYYLLFILTLLPGLLPLFIPVIDADTVAIMAYPQDYGPTFWFSVGRPGLFCLIMPLISAGNWLGFTHAATMFSTVYLLLFTGWLWLFVQVLQIVMSRRGAWITAVFIGLHFHMYEMRMWSGSIVILGFLPVMAAVLLAFQMDRKRFSCTLIATIGMFLGLNLHQSGAFGLAALLGLLGTAALLDYDDTRRDVLLTRCRWIITGAAIACGLYFAEVLIIRQTVGLTSRAERPDILLNAGRFFKALWAWAPAILPLPQIARQPLNVFHLLALALLATVAVALRPLPWRKLAFAACIAIIAALASTIPTIITEGSFSSRVLLGPLVAIWGITGMLLARLPWQRHFWMRLYLVVFLAAAMFIHWWGFGLVVLNKHVPVSSFDTIRAGLQNAGVTAADKLQFYSENYEAPVIGWSDSAYNLYSAPWGVRGELHFITRSLGIKGEPRFEFLPDKPWLTGAKCEDQLVCRVDQETVAINGHMLAAYQRHVILNYLLGLTLPGGQ